jgi:GNAT superfamily N-acetyltransferase
MNNLESALTPTVSAIAPADIERAVAALTFAFMADPVARWQYPDPGEYLALFPAFVRAFGGDAITQGTARHVEDHTGVALWLAPGMEPDHAAIEACLPPGRAAEIAAVFEEMAAYHPHEEHWYLPLIGVDPIHQNKGHGDALLRDALRRCDREHLAAYLESTNPANVTLYQRHGFEVRGTIRAGSSPPLFPMLRRAR